MDDPSPKRRSLADVMAVITLTCAAVALIRVMAQPTYERPLLGFFYWPGLIATTAAAIGTCVVGWQQALRWAGIAFVVATAALLLWGLYLARIA